MVQSAEELPPRSSDPGCHAASTEPAMLTASVGTAPDAEPTMRLLALISIGAASPPLAAAVRTCPATSSALETLIARRPASAGSVGCSAPAAFAAALKKVEARLTSY